MNKTNIKILIMSFVLGFLFLGLTDSIKSVNNIPNQSAGVILTQNNANNYEPTLITPPEGSEFYGNYQYDTSIDYNPNTMYDNTRSATNNNDYSTPTTVLEPITPNNIIQDTGTTSMTTNSGEEGIVTCSGATECNITEFGKTARNLIKMAIEIGLILAALAFAYAGWLFMTAQGSSDKISQAKGIFWKVLIGVIIAMSAFAIVEIILNSLGVTGGIGTWVNDFIG